MLDSLGLFCRSSMFAGSGCFFVLVLYYYVGVLLKVEGSLIIEWFMLSGVMNTNFIWVMDGFSVLFSLVVLFISFLIMLFSTSYMMGELFLSRFVWLVMLFVISMNFLIFVPSMIGIILGWDGLGLISFLLVIYYQNSKSFGAGMVTAFMNRVGDSLLLLGLSILSTCGHWSFWGWEKVEVLMFMVLFLVVLSCTKSAQFPFSYWLPAAMSAPTPVSALVHSSTLVTAGVYLLIRVIPNIVVSSSSEGCWLIIVSVFTMLMAGISACFEVDMKKVVALSTLSQLGVMMFSLSLGYFSLAFFHLLSHALFKALLFVGVGCVIHGQNDWQDFRVISGLWMKMPLVSGCILLSGMALSGLPFLGGYYSKDLIIEGFLSGGMSVYLSFVVFFSLMMSAIYMGRLIFGSVLGGETMVTVNLGNSSVSMFEIVPLIMLGLASTCGGWFLQSSVFDFSDLFLLEFGLKNFVNLVIISGGLLVFLWVLLSMGSYHKKSIMNNFTTSFVSSMFFMSNMIRLLSYAFLKGSLDVYKVIDLGWNESVLGSLSLFDYLLGMSDKFLYMWRGTYGWGVWLSMSFFLVMFLFLVS